MKDELSDYLFRPTKEQFFKTKHPFLTIPLLLPLCIYSLYTRIQGYNSWLLLVGCIGSFLLGFGLSYFAAIRLKVYTKKIVPITMSLSGGILIAISLWIMG